MTENHDPLLEAISSLRTVAPDANWEKRVRARCHSEIALRATGSIQAIKRTVHRLTLVDLTAVAFLCVYLCVLLREAARLGGLL
jgi:hypothetical protein